MIFVDTSFWAALQFRNDRNHELAVDLWKTSGRSLVTSNHVLGESWTLLRRKLHHRAAVMFVEEIARSRNLTVVRVREPVEASAWSWLLDRDEREYSFVDATSFALMRRLGITKALAFDGDFAAAGFVELRP